MLRITASFVAAAAIAISFTACGGGDGGASASSADLTSGQKVFSETCATCHGQDANGVTGLGKGLRGNAFVKDNSDRELIDFIMTGRSASDPQNTTGVDMPPKGGNPALTDEDIAAVVAYVRTL